MIPISWIFDTENYHKFDQNDVLKKILFEVKLIGGSRDAATSKMERFVIIVND